MKKEGVIVLIILLVSIIFVSFISAESNETETEEAEPETCPASISINFNQDVYYEGDNAKFTVEVFDSQGNKIPNYPFYVSIYEYSVNHWDETSSPGMTNNEGYFEFSRVVGEGDSKGKFLYKVHTEETSSCAKAEDSIEIEFRAKETEEESEPEPNESPHEIKTCATGIDVNFDKDVYYYGDRVKVEVKVLDSQGNPLPNYPFKSQISTNDGLWHTGDPGRTDRNGYFIQNEGRIEEGMQPLGKLKFRIYTPDSGEYSNCNSVEDIVEFEIKIRERSEPVPCGIGTCIPEEEPKEPEVIPEDKIFYACSGCELEDKCYPIGYRKQGKYCSDNYEFIEQSETGICDNSFECKSNVCISGECVGESLIKKIIKWFKKLFGGDENEEESGLEMCSKLLIEKNIGDYEYFMTEYGKREEQQMGLFSEDGEQIDIVKCCVAGYKNPDGTEGKAGIVCPFNNKKDVENALRGLSNMGEIVLGEYKEQKIYRRFDKPEETPEIIVWTNKVSLIASGVGPGEGQISEEVADAYLDKYPNDLGVVDED